MKGSTTYITDPENPGNDPKSFTFDHSYWSHDGCKKMDNGYFGPDTSHPNGKKFCDQKTVFNDLGVAVYNNAWEGFNSTLFAYGQTGSGKSWSVVGYGINKGIVPQFAEKLFQGISEQKDSGTVFEVTYSMLEIYMEEVRDLLDNKPKRKGGLRIRQHPKKGFYAEGLQYVAVGSYQDIEAKMEQGTTNRTVASTNMNATSSRAHTIVGITFVQKSKNAAGEETAKTSVVNLVDLAGSERADSTGATGDRLKEGAAINQSLSSLGNVIAALADRCEGKNVKVPYRDSVLTKLLMNALGGNSKTVMIAAISPADINYEESVSTLRYADRAKQIKTKATVNEDPTEKLIRELQEENEKLKQMLSGGGVELPKGDGEMSIEETDNMSAAEKAQLKQQLEEEYKAQLEENDREMEEMRKSYEEKLKLAQELDGGMTEKLQEQHVKEAKDPYITNINYDQMLSHRIVHFVDLQKETVGKKGKGDEEKCDIPLVGPSIQEDHAVFTREGDKVFLEKLNPAGRLLHNGVPMSEKTELQHNDRLIFGTTNYFVFCFPHHEGKGAEEITYEMMQDELSQKAGYDLDNENKSKDDMLLQEDIADMLPGVEEANAISAELDKKKKFEMLMVSPEARGELKGRKQIFVRVLDMETGLEWMWPRDTFFDKRFIMQEMFNKREEGEEWQLPKDRDPFELDPNVEMTIGVVKVFPKSLAYELNLKSQMEIIDFRGQEVGRINIEMVPCDQKGKEKSDDESSVEAPSDLHGKDVHFLIKIQNARGLPRRFTGIYAKLQFYDGAFVSTKPVNDTQNPDWNFNKQFDFTAVTQEFVDYLSNGAFIIQIVGKQKPQKQNKTVNTRDIMSKEALAKGQLGAGFGGAFGKVVDPDKVKFFLESATMSQRVKKTEQRLNQVKQLIQIAESHKAKKIPTSVLKELVYAPSKDEAEKILKWKPNKGHKKGEGK